MYEPVGGVTRYRYDMNYHVYDYEVAAGRRVGVIEKRAANYLTKRCISVA